MLRAAFEFGESNDRLLVDIHVASQQKKGGLMRHWSEVTARQRCRDPPRELTISGAALAGHGAVVLAANDVPIEIRP
jgi:hypothetical protein